MAAVGLALISAVLFGGMSVGLRLGLNRRPDAALATLATVVGAFGVTLVAMIAEAPSRGVDAGGAWPFLLAGILQPGIGQLLVTLAIREAGASRASVVFGSAPLVSVAIALVLLGEPLRWALVVGAVLIVAGGVELARERGRPEHLRTIGLVYAFCVTILFSARDNLIRWLSHSTDVPPGTAAAATLASGVLVVAAVLVPRVERWRGVLPFLGVGLLFGLSYVSLFEAYYRGRVTVVSPLIATESLWGVLLTVLFLRHSELVGRRRAHRRVPIATEAMLLDGDRHPRDRCEPGRPDAEGDRAEQSRGSRCGEDASSAASTARRPTGDNILQGEAISAINRLRFSHRRQ